MEIAMAKHHKAMSHVFGTVFLGNGWVVPNACWCHKNLLNGCGLSLGNVSLILGW